jgi:hypothetical protein
MADKARREAIYKAEVLRPRADHDRVRLDDLNKIKMRLLLA